MPGATPSETEGTPTHDQAYADAFAAAAAGDGVPPASDPAPAAEPAPAAAPAGDAPAAGEGAAPAAEPGAAPAGGAAGDAGADGKAAAPGGAPAEPAAAPAAAEPAQAPASADDIVKGLADLLKQQPPAAAPAAEPAAQPAAEEQQPIYTQDELTVLTEYEKNWPDVAQAETLKRRAEYNDLMKYIFGEVAKFTQPLFEQMRQVGNNLHLGELRAAVPDYSEQLEADVAAWIDTQPNYLQTGMKQVMQQGTSEEVADLIGRYRAATGAATPAPAPSPAPAPAPAKPAQTELSSAAKQAAESLAPVSGDRSVVPEGENSQDYESAFAKYASTMDG